MSEIDASLSKAIVMYLGFDDGRPTPGICPERLVAEFGREKAVYLRCAVELIMMEVDHLKPDFKAHTWETFLEWIKDQVHSRYPALDGTALNALAWAYCWWWK